MGITGIFCCGSERPTHQLGNRERGIQGSHEYGPSRKAEDWKCDGSPQKEVLTQRFGMKVRAKCEELERIFVLARISLLLKAKVRHLHDWTENCT